MGETFAGHGDFDHGPDYAAFPLGSDASAFVDSDYPGAGGHGGYGYADPGAPTESFSARPDAFGGMPGVAAGAGDGYGTEAGGFGRAAGGDSGTQVVAGGFGLGPDGRFDGPGAGAGVIDLSGPWRAPATHRGRRRRHVAVLVAAAAGVMIAGGAGYAVFRPTDDAPAAAEPVTTASATPTAEPEPTLEVLPEPSGATVRSTPTGAAPATGDPARDPVVERTDAPFRTPVPLRTPIRPTVVPSMSPPVTGTSAPTTPQTTAPRSTIAPTEVPPGLPALPPATTPSSTPARDE